MCPLYQCTPSPQHGGTQNANESFENVIWTRLPNTAFVSRTAFEFGVHDAVLSFNNGNAGRCRVVTQLGMTPGHQMIRAMRAADAERVCGADKSMTDFERQQRQKRRACKNRFWLSLLLLQSLQKCLQRCPLLMQRRKQQCYPRNPKKSCLFSLGRPFGLEMKKMNVPVNRHPILVQKYLQSCKSCKSNRSIF
jgi:hypothetical protein